MSPSEKVPLKIRMALWIAYRKLKKEVKGMKSLPKWVGWLAIICATCGTGGALAGLIPLKIAAILATAGTYLSNITHSLPGTGGQTQ